MTKSLCEANKAGIMKWRESNREYYNEYQRKASSKYYNANKEKVKMRQNKYYAFQKQAKILRNVLMENN